MLRAILKLVAVGAVIAVFGVADSIELYAIGGGALLLLPFVIHRIDRPRCDRRARQAVAIDEPKSRAHTTLDVIPLPRPQATEDDIEGLTVRAPMSHEQAYEMHARYAPSFDQQSAIARYEAQRLEAPAYGADAIPEAVPEHDPPPMFDQGRYATALQYADAFEEQLTRTRRTAAYQVAQPRRIARGSYTPQQYRAVDTRSDQLAMSPSDWDEKTLIGVHPMKPTK